MLNERFYFPLKITMYNAEDDEIIELPNSYILEHQDAISGKLDDEQNFDNTTMLDFFDKDDIKEKITSMRWGICELDDRAYGFVNLELKEKLTSDDIEKLKDWITGQNSDGLGEGFEQREITDNGETFSVSMWSSEDYFIKTKNEMNEYLNKYTVNIINVQDLRHMKGLEGLILQGCGGSVADWITGINDMFKESGILLEGTKFRSVYKFENEGLTNLLYPFSDDVKLNIGKLAMWRLATHANFSGKWLSDYVDNRLGGFVDDEKVEPSKPICRGAMAGDNVFAIMGAASQVLKQVGRKDDANEMLDRVTNSGSYGEALNIIGEYVELDFPNEDMSEDEGMGGIS